MSMMMRPRPMPGMGGGGGGLDFLGALGGGGGMPGMAPGRPPVRPPAPMEPDADDAGSPLLAALQGAMAGGGGDPYAVGPMPTDLNVGTGEPQMGLEQLLEMLGMAMAGTGGLEGQRPGGAYAGSSGLDTGNYPMGQTPGAGGY